VTASTPTFSIAVVTFNRAALVARALDSVLAQRRTDYEIVVLDNDSRDGTSDMIAARYPQARLVRLARNVGCPDGRNHLYANCRGEFIVNLDDDGWMSEPLLDQLEAVFRQDERIGVVAMRQSFPDGGENAGRAMSSQFQDIGVFVGCASALRRSMLQRTGVFPSDFFLFAEETYLALRVLDAGYRIVSAPEIVMWHPHIGGSQANNRHDYQLFRNPLLVTLRLYPLRYLLMYLPARIVSHFFQALRRGSLLSYFRAVASVAAAIPSTLMNRTPVRAEAVAMHLGTRGSSVVFKNSNREQALSGVGA
jgi:GT2 family glycosyltransferase